MKNLGQLGKLAPEGFKGYQAFSAAATKAGKLSAKFKEIIAVAVAMQPNVLTVSMSIQKKQLI